MILSNYTETAERIEIKSKTQKLNCIILFNDDVNTFEWVIECLMLYCQHDAIQAEQCATIVHYNGKCEVKTGSLKALKPICETLLEKGLSAAIN